MKKAMLILGCSMLALGLGLGGLGRLMGGSAWASVHLFGNTWDVHALTPGWSVRTVKTISVDVVDSAEATPMPEPTPTMELEQAQANEITTFFSYPNSESPTQGIEVVQPFTCLAIDIDLGDVLITSEGDEYTVSVSYWGDGYEVNTRVEDEVVKIQSKGGKKIHLGSSQYGSNVVITVPKALDSLRIDNDCGSVTLDGLTVHELNVDLDLGDVTGGNLTVLGQLKVDADLGTVNLSGDLGENVDVSANLGAVCLNLSRPASDYFWKLTADLGKITVDGLTQKSKSGKSVKGGVGGRSLMVDADLGNIDVNFGFGNETAATQVTEGTAIVPSA